MVEAQHKVSTRPLVDSLDEQELLERIIEEVKPPPPSGERFRGGHFLLWTPFRYPPLRNGSRFGRRTEPSLWYGASALMTALAEKAYYQLVFLDGTTADLRVSVDWTAFSVGVRAARAVDLTRPTFDVHEHDLASPSSYLASQRLGSEMRAAGIEAFLFRSARCPLRGTNVGLFEPVFAEQQPREIRTWRCQATKAACEMFALHGFELPVAFTRATFEVDGVLPSPAV